MWIRKLFVSLSLTALLFTTGCVSVDQFKVSTKPVSEMTVQEKAVAAVNQVDAAVTATAITTLTYYNQKLLTYKEKTAYADALEDASKMTDRARTLAQIGDYEGSETQLKLAQLALDAVKVELAKYKAKEAKETN